MKKLSFNNPEKNFLVLARKKLISSNGKLSYTC